MKMRMQMQMLSALTAMFISLSYSVSSPAQDALATAQQLLLDQKTREDVLASNEKARAADDFADKTVNGDQNNKERLYQLASQALAYLAHKYQGDASKMQKEMERAIRDPDQFRNSLPPELQKQMEELARKVESGKALNSN